MYSLSRGHGSKPLDKILKQWQEEAPIAGSAGKQIMEQKPNPSKCRRPNIAWIKPAVVKVLDLLDSDGRSFSFTQIAKILNDPATREMYRHPQDTDREFTSGNVRNLVLKLFPADQDTQMAIALLEEAKTWTGWESMDTVSKTIDDIDEFGNPRTRLYRLTVLLPLAPLLLERFGDFVVLDCTFQLTIYEGRFGIHANVVDNCGHVHMVSHTDVPGHRESKEGDVCVCMLAIFNEVLPA